VHAQGELCLVGMFILQFLTVPLLSGCASYAALADVIRLDSAQALNPSQFNNNH